MTEIQKILFELKDEKYKDFQSALIPNIEKDIFIGVPTPKLKCLAKELYKTEKARRFLNTLPHKYFDENQLHAFLIALEKNFEICLEETEKFLPYIDNWATCDQLSPKCFRGHPERLKQKIPQWLDSNHTYTIRFGIESYMRYFLDDKFDIEYPSRISQINSDEYYVNMMIAWYFATALAKQWDNIFVFIKENRLPIWVHNKTIQKAIESNRITKEQKEILKKFKRR